MARALIIANPVASRTTPARTVAVERVFRANGWRVDVAQTEGPGDARRLAAAGVSDGVDSVVVFGGDGTTMQAAAALVGTEVALGLVPGGTGNVLAGNLRLPRRPVPAAELITRGRSRRIDLGRIDRPDGRYYFAVACGAGADATVMSGTPPEEKRRLGIGGYFASLFRSLSLIRSARTVVTVDGARLEGRAALALVANCPEMIPPLARIGNEIRLDDGQLDLIVIAADTPWECARGFFRVFQNVVLGTGETAYLRYARGREITIEMDPEQPTQFDGDLMAGGTPLAITVEPLAIRVMAPALAGNGG
ncbi:MAG: diacylglycerol kinase family lipid kinase [Gemmatimonadales bacterium]